MAEVLNTVDIENFSKNQKIVQLLPEVQVDIPEKLSKFSNSDTWYTVFPCKSSGAKLGSSPQARNPVS